MLYLLFLFYAILLAATVLLMKRNEFVGQTQKEMINEFYEYLKEYYIPEYYSKKRSMPYKKFDFDDYSYSYEYILYRMFYTRDKEQFWKKDFRKDIEEFLKQA